MSNVISKEGIDFIKSFESFSPTAYNCPAGILTIGYGHKVKSYESYKTISCEEANQILKHDVALAEKAVIRNIHVPLSQKQFDALVSFTFNLGAGALQRSSLRQKINYGADLEEIYCEFIKWIYSKGKKLLGLYRRRIAEAEFFASKSFLPMVKYK